VDVKCRGVGVGGVKCRGVGVGGCEVQRCWLGNEMGDGGRDGGGEWHARQTNNNLSYW